MHHIIKGSVFFPLYEKLAQYYASSFVRSILLSVAEVYTHSMLGRCLAAVATRESTMEHSVFVRVLALFFGWVDRIVTGISAAISKWSESSILMCFLKDVIKASNERLFVLAFPIFGVGYMAGRIYRDRLMIRDVLFLGLLFIVGAIWMIAPEKKRMLWRNSAIVRFCNWILG